VPIGADDEFSPDLLKEGFNCRDPARAGISQSTVVNGWKTNAGPVALWGARRYISGSKSP
jgi:hypothetical protein